MPAENRDYESAWWRGLMSRRPGRRGRFGGAAKFYPWANVPGCSAFWDSSRGLVLAGSDVTTAADQATGGVADPASGAAGLEPQFVASDGGGPCFNFATGRYFTLTHSTDLDFTAGFTVTGWIRRSVAGIQQEIWSQANAGNQKLRIVLLASNTLAVLEEGGATGDVQVTYGVSLAWRHFAVTYDGSLAAASRVAVYLDGSAQSLAINVNFPASLPAVTKDRIAVFAPDDSSAPLNGRLAWLGLWKRALTPVEVLAVMNYKRRT